MAIDVEDPHDRTAAGGVGHGSGRTSQRRSTRLVSQGGHDGEPRLDPVGEQVADPGVRALVNFVGLGAKEDGGDHYAPVHNEAVDRAVMPVELLWS